MGTDELCASDGDEFYRRVVEHGESELAFVAYDSHFVFLAGNVPGKTPRGTAGKSVFKLETSIDGRVFARFGRVVRTNSVSLDDDIKKHLEDVELMRSQLVEAFFSVVKLNAISFGYVEWERSKSGHRA